ncbi:hypothetical protein [Myxococcus sp. CA040A]|uniref:hypothetical protein n=1 Tax=Myxococcus sp. CA040A TaxID=2741738 RepID=UPI00157A948D|nr:hypothetical protein [Myxococcus sp. CA040A]NTX07555.1 hypothetical protein [Myxococcus sp. CA040A]
MRRMFRLLCCVGVLAACGGSETDEDFEQESDPGTRLASVKLADGQAVTFYEVPDYGIVTVVKGPRGTPMPDAAAFDGMPIPDIYRKLSGGQEPPAALVEAARRVPSALAQTPVREAMAPEGKAQTSLGPSGDGVSQLAVPDTAWWSANFCQGLNTEYDELWCPLGVYSWAHTGWGPVQKYYQACATTGEATGSLWMDKWASGAWQRLQTATLPKWWWTCVWGVGAAQYRSGLDATANALFVARYRYAIPNIIGSAGDLPADRSYPNFADNIQGITHNSTHWFLTRNTTNFWKDEATNGIIAKQAMTAINDDPPERFHMPTPWYNAGFRHYGDLVHVNGYLYIAMDGPSQGGAVGVFNTSMQYIGYASLPNWSGGVAFLAYNPRDGLFYAATNAFGATSLRGYSIGLSGNTVIVTHKRTLTLSSSIPVGAWIQGGKISARGNLYISVGGGGQTSGIYMVDVVNGFVQTYYYVPYGSSDEFEGLDLWDLDADQRIGARGQIHMQKINIDLPGFADDYWLSHYRVDDPSKL